MSTTATVLEEARTQLGAFLPRLLGALVLLVVGLIAARLFGRVVRKGLQAAGLDAAAERFGVPDVLARAGLGRSLAVIAGTAVRLVITVIIVFAALSLLGLQFLSPSLNEGVLFLPKLLAAGVLLLAGVVLGALARDRTERTSVQMDLPISIGPVVQALVIAIFAITAAAQLTIPTGPLLLLLGIVLAALIGTLTLAFGLGAREIARALSATRYARGAFREGQTIRVGDLRGTIERIDSAATVLRAGDETIRVPNHRLVEDIVIIED